MASRTQATKRRVSKTDKIDSRRHNVKNKAGFLWVGFYVLTRYLTLGLGFSYNFYNNSVNHLSLQP